MRRATSPGATAIDFANGLQSEAVLRDAHADSGQVAHPLLVYGRQLTLQLQNNAAMASWVSRSAGKRLKFVG
jgi:hypothetical protein